MGKLHVELEFTESEGLNAKIIAAGSTKELLAAAALVTKQVIKQLMVAAPTDEDIDYLRLISGSTMLDAINAARDEAREEIRQHAGGEA